MVERSTVMRRLSEIPMTDGLLDRALDGPRLAPPGPSGGRRAAVAALALLIGALGVALAFRAFDGGQMPASVVDDVNGLTVDVPPGWEGARVTFEDGTGYRGFLLTSYPNGGASPAGWILEPEVPVGGTMVQIAGGGAVSWGPDPFPLDLQRDGQTSPLGAYLPFLVRGASWEIFVTYGGEPDDGMRRQAQALVASVRMQPLKEPAPGSAILDQGVLSVGPADRYPESSVTPVEVTAGTGALAGEILWVVRAPSMPYAFRATQSLGSGSCRITWREHAGAFVCGDAAWDIRGDTLNEAAIGSLTTIHVGGVDPDGAMWLSFLGDIRSSAAQAWE